jgi:hypothetical protein
MPRDSIGKLYLSHRFCILICKYSGFFDSEHLADKWIARHMLCSWYFTFLELIELLTFEKVLFFNFCSNDLEHSIPSSQQTNNSFQTLLWQTIAWSIHIVLHKNGNWNSSWLFSWTKIEDELLNDFRITGTTFVEKQASARERRLKEKCDQVIRNNTDKAYVVRCWTTNYSVQLFNNRNPCGFAV